MKETNITGSLFSLCVEKKEKCFLWKKELMEKILNEDKVQTGQIYDFLARFSRKWRCRMEV